MSNEKKLQVKDLTISFRTVNGKLQAVRDISFDLYKGETLAIVGESGSGKSATSKTILGISAANTIVEGGEILYDGKDLLKITEEDFHSIRGDKIAMVFQDPLSSLNPIMRVGKQLTEAQLLKNKASRRECKKKLTEGMKSLHEAMSASGCNVDKSLFETFRAIIKEQSKYEGPYDTAHTNAVAALKAADDMLLAIDKDALTRAKDDAKELKNYAVGAINHFVVRDGEKLKAVVKDMMANAAAGAKSKDYSALKATVTELRAMLQAGVDAVMPDFFALGCYIVLDKKTLGDESAEVLNQLTAGSLRGDFMTKFLNFTVSALKYTAAESKTNMAAAVAKLAEAEKFFAEMPAEDAARKFAGEVTAMVEKAIDPLETVKDSSAYTFRVSLNSALDTYYNGVTGNVAEQKRFDKQTAKYEAAVARGKTPNGKVAPLALVDLDVAQESVQHILTGMREQFIARAEVVNQYDYQKRGERYIQWLRDTALGENHKITRSMAKDTAIRIMEQVGITEARKRFRQYPFEFSGGMRQRIVIAIALTADPDILICDEPTTALDVTIQAQILELINNLKRERNLSVIFITHDLGVVANMADRIAVMYAGKIVEYGTAEDVFYHPAHPYTWALLASIPDLNSKGAKLEAIPGTPPNMIYPPVGDAFAARNKYALQIDFEQQPPMFQISDTHYAATWLLHPDAPKMEMPQIVKDRIARMSKIGGNDNG
ncbi:MAG: ABC transporter ATP-binding protein [Oscillospiraceae bacterium]|nr:ABC transporter ATP-binding protein [Oscillospiraceae bacterium]